MKREYISIKCGGNVLRGGEMIFRENILLDYTFDDSVSEIDCNLNWQEFADGDYVEMELTQDNNVILSGDTTYDSILEVIDSFLKGVVFGAKEDVICVCGIKTPIGYYECKRKIYQAVK